MVELSADMSQKMFQIHFGASDYRAITCKKCLDYRVGQCDGKDYRGAECLRCIETHAKASHSIDTH